MYQIYCVYYTLHPLRLYETTTETITLQQTGAKKRFPISISFKVTADRRGAVGLIPRPVRQQGTRGQGFKPSLRDLPHVRSAVMGTVRPTLQRCSVEEYNGGRV